MADRGQCFAKDCTQRSAHRIPIALTTRGPRIGAIFADVCTDHYRNWIGRAIMVTGHPKEQRAIPAA